MLRLDKKVRRKGQLLSYETRYFISSLDPDVSPATECQDFILHHRDVENGLHWMKDKHFEEDKHRLKGMLGEVWSVLTGIAVSVVRLRKTEKMTVFICAALYSDQWKHCWKAP